MCSDPVNFISRLNCIVDGVTIFPGAMPNTNPSIVDEESMNKVRVLASQKAKCDYGIFVGASSSNASTLPPLASPAFALKMYLDNTFTSLKLDNMSIWIEHFKNWPKDRCIHSPSFTSQQLCFFSFFIMCMCIIWNLNYHTEVFVERNWLAIVISSCIQPTSQRIKLSTNNANNFKHPIKSLN
jgi:hypothetical protein